MAPSPSTSWTSTVDAGRITVFVGPSGCGKTTSLRMINRMIEPTGGTILVDGKDIMAGRPAELRRGIGYVIQQAGLFPHRTILDNIATVPLLLGLEQGEGRARGRRELMETVGLAPEMAKRYPTQLSGGQQQRVGVARALAADPPILLMDEPFSAVDPVVRESLQEELLRLQGELGKTIVFVTHDIDEAVKLGDKVAVLRVGGKLAQYDEPGQLLARPVDDFVDNFVGRDRGYRGLGFRSSAALTLGELPTVALGEKPCPPTRAGCSSSTPRAARRAGSTPPSPRPTAPVGARAPRARRLAVRRGVRLAAQRARRRAVLAVRGRGGGRRAGRGRRVGQRRRRAARARRRPPRRDAA